MTLKMTTAQVVETSVTVTNSSFQNYTHPDNHTTQTSDTPGFKPFTKEKFDAHTDPIFKELKILKLDDIYLFHLGKFMYLFQNNLLQRPFGNLILWTNQVHNYNTRSSNQNLFYVPFCRTNLRQFCVHYQGPFFFNTLNSDIRNASSVSQFKTFLKNYLLSRF